jgi:hypothetical protein
MGGPKISDGLSRQRRWQLRRTAEGCCQTCGLPLNKHSYQCDSCSEKSTIREKRRYKQRISNGKCPCCGREHSSSTVVCPECLEDKSSRVKRLKSEGRCIRCGAITEGRFSCNACIVIGRERARKRRGCVRRNINAMSYQISKEGVK